MCPDVLCGLHNEGSLVGACQQFDWELKLVVFRSKYLDNLAWSFTFFVAFIRWYWLTNFLPLVQSGMVLALMKLKERKKVWTPTHMVATDLLYFVTWLPFYHAESQMVFQWLPYPLFFYMKMESVVINDNGEGPAKIEFLSITNNHDSERFICWNIEVWIRGQNNTWCMD